MSYYPWARIGFWVEDSGFGTWAFKVKGMRGFGHGGSGFTLGCRALGIWGLKYWGFGA